MVCLSVILNWIAVLILVGVNIVDFFTEFGIPKKIINVGLLILFFVLSATGKFSFTC